MQGSAYNSVREGNCETRQCNSGREYLKVIIFLWVLMFDIFADWHKNENFVHANKSFTGL